MPGFCSFREQWLSDDAFKSWLRKDPSSDKRKAFCILCKKSINIGSMGEGAVISHAKGAKHKKLVDVSKPTVSISSFCTSGSQSTHSSNSTTGISASTCQGTAVLQSTSQQTGASTLSSSITSFCTSEDVLRAEIKWCFKCADSHYSMHSCANIGKLFKDMFPDSKIATQFACADKKTAYLTTFGLGPYFRDELFKQVRCQSSFVILFDETLNPELQEKQMDIYLRIWNGPNVTTFFCDSEFLGHARAEGIHDRLSPLLHKLSLQKLLQLSMDGPNVNLKVLRLLQEDVQMHSTMKMLEVGTCGLHVLHNAFRSGCAATTWEIEDFLTSIYYLFKDAPARREDFIEVSGARKLPLKFCTHRWMENIEPAERAIELLPHLVAFCSAAKNKTITEPTCKSFKVILKAMGDPLIKAKLQFFICIAKDVQPFLKLYQTDAPMIPFISTDLGSLVKTLMERFIKADVIASCKSVFALASVDCTDSKNFLDVNKVDVGFCTTQTLRSTKTGSSDRDCFAFRKECRGFLSAMLKKMLNKAPIKYPLVRSLTWLDPRLIVRPQDASTRVKQLEHTLRIMCDAGRIQEENCDAIKKQYGSFCDHVVSDDDVSETFHNFSPSEARADALFHEQLEGRKEFSLLWDLVRMLLLLSHGQATVERGFSVNKETSVDNLKKKSLVARRLVIDAIRKAGGPTEVTIGKELLLYSSSARRQYETYLQEERAKKEGEMRSQKRKAEEELIDKMNAKRRQIEKDIKSLETSASEKYDAAEKNGSMSLVVEANAVRRRATEKKAELTKLESLIKEKLGGQNC